MAAELLGFSTQRPAGTGLTRGLGSACQTSGEERRGRQAKEFHDFVRRNAVDVACTGEAFGRASAREIFKCLCVVRGADGRMGKIIQEKFPGSLGPLTKGAMEPTTIRSILTNMVAFPGISIEGRRRLIGTTRSRVSHFMNKFRKLGLIEYNGHMEIHTSLLNVVLHDDPHIDG